MYFLSDKKLGAIRDTWAASVAAYSLLKGETALILGIIAVESGGNANAISAIGARGLMQVLPSGALAEYVKTEKLKISADALYDPKLNIVIGSWYMNRLIEEYHFTLFDALRAYNTGPSRARANAQAGSQYALRVLSYAYRISSLQ